MERLKTVGVIEMLKITLTSGLVAKQEKQKKVVRALGLRKFGSSVVHHDSPTIRGMINKVQHLVTVTTADGAEAKAARPAKAKAAAKPAAAKTKTS
jgi:large subunit ribosomal protein L30